MKALEILKVCRERGQKREAGYAYDKYVIDNNLEHTINGLYIREK